MSEDRAMQVKTINEARERPLSILLIEDSDMDTELIHRALRQHMKIFHFHRAPTMKEGEKILEEGGPDLVLLDLGLPDTANPADTYEQIKKWTDKVPVVILTNLDNHDLAKVMVQEGVADFLHKDAITKDPRRAVQALEYSHERHARHRQLLSEKDRAVQDSKEKDSILNVFMGGYSILK